MQANRLARFYPQGKAEQLALKKDMQRLGLGVQAFQKLGAPRRNSASGKYARRLGRMLKLVHFDGNLRMCLSPIAGESSPRRKKRLEARGWLPWMVKLYQLPELTAASVDDWFEVGWEALEEACGRDVTLNPELNALGESNARYGRSRAKGRGRRGKQRSRKAGQIKRLLHDAFVARFGN